uniref:Peptidase_M14 domain-containing protein n=1 Tax=Meloidogyne hapla TaxID=6305 RepID=A0A1I8BUN8_MELHA
MANNVNKYLIILYFFILINKINSKPKSNETKQNIIYSVLRLRAENETQLNFLMNEFLNNSVKLDFWKEPSNIGEDTHVMVAKGPILDDFRNRLNKYNLTIQIMIEDVNELIKKRQKEIEENKEKEEEENIKKQKENIIFRRQRDEPFINSPRLRKATSGSLGRFSLGKYKSFADIIHYMNALAVNYPNRVTVQPIGSTHEGRQIPLIKIGTNNNLIGKPAIWIDGGIHAREWVSPAVVLFMIDQLVIGYDTQPLIKQFVDQLDWFIVPLLNPDGYEYSRSSSDPEVRLWRENRSPTQCTQIST